MDADSRGDGDQVRILILHDYRDDIPNRYIARDIAWTLRCREGLCWVTSTCYGDLVSSMASNGGDALKTYSADVEGMVEWADLLLVTCLQADTLAKMLHGFADTFLLRVLRSWNVAKKIAVIPAMSRLMWENPMTKKQLSKIRRNWSWIRVFDPLVWDPKESPGTAYQRWTGMQECVDVLENQIDLMTRRHHLKSAMSSNTASLNTPWNKVELPSELWSIILEYTGDWELATTLGIYTNLPAPAEWQPTKAKSCDFMHDLEWTILTGSLQAFVRLFQTRGPPKALSKLCVKLIIKFARTDVLSYLEANHKNLFRAQFMPSFLLPTKASGVFGQTAILDWWQQCPSYVNKDYTADALDLASKSGYIHVLQWWRNSGLLLRYTDAALEQASAQGQVGVLEWWRSASYSSDRELDFQDNADAANGRAQGNNKDDGRNEAAPLRLKVGKSLIYAAQNGQVGAIKWWMSSGIPTVHEEAVARTASAHGHVDILGLWKEIKGEKMQYDNQVLVGPTKNGHVDVLEWWKSSGYRVEYKTCDIEEALEDSVGGRNETKIRSWWARNGLNLGVGTSEWMKVKIL
ncbi:MAG: hypothetical protein LQ345_005897 [Seirophora villosa]|nr:MAG: hypothetical protein LQ345_005897 [Seirophora villosa]